MADPRLTAYLEEFVSRANSAGLQMRKLGQNWAPMAPILPGTHISLSVSRGSIQVNLNNENDADRTLFDKLRLSAKQIEEEIGHPLEWEAKAGVKKTAVRATFERGYEDDTLWEAQHEWAIDMMRRFDQAFGKRLRPEV